VFFLARKQVILIIVEGPSDDTALGAIFNRIYDSNTVYVHIMHGDITTRINNRPDNIVAKIGNEVREYAKQYSLTSKDFSEIIHIIDTDGAYIPDSCIIENINISETIYSEHSITAKNKNNIINRNLQKRQNLNRLSTCNIVWNIPYRIFYMSCNLDHALYGSLNLSDEEKETYAYQFALRYRDNIPEFRNFISNSDFSVMLPYRESWNFIKLDCESLIRHTNLGLCLPNQENE
jgi:hypothetical protein